MKSMQSQTVKSDGG